MKKFTSIIVCLIVAIACSLTTGCASFKINKVSYYNAVVAKVGDSKITRHDLLSAYNAYGKSKYLSDSDNNESAAIKKTLEYLEQQEALYLFALDDLAKYELSANQRYNALESIFDTIDSDLESLTKEAYAILNIKMKEADTSTDEDDDEDEVTVSSKAYTIEDYMYTKRATVVTSSVDGEAKTVIKYIIEPIEKVDGDESLNEDHKLHSLLIYLDDPTAPEKDIILEIKDSYFKYMKSSINSYLEENAKDYSEDMVEPAYNKVRSLLATNLINYEYYLRDDNGNPYNTTTEDLFYRYISRIYNSKIKQCYIDNVKTEYFRSVELDVDKLIDKYNELVKADYEAYANKEDDKSYVDKLKNIGTAGDTLYYHETLDDQRAGYFLHTLIQFAGKMENKKYVSGEGYNANNLKSTEPDEDQYNAKMAELINNMKVNYRGEDGEFAREDGNLLSVTFAQVLEDYSQVTDLDSFLAFMFKYSKDDGTLSTSTPYVVGGNNDGTIDENDLSNGVWEEAFTKEGIRILYSNGDEYPVEGTKSQEITAVENKISADDIKNLCITSYGIHFLYYVGEVNQYDIPYSSDDDNIYIDTLDSQPTKYNLYTKILNNVTNETYFDKLFNLVYPVGEDSTEIYAKENDYEEYEKTTYTEVLNNTHKKVEYNDTINSTKTNID